MLRAGAELEGGHVVVGGHRRAVVPHQVRIQLEGPDQAAVVHRPFGGRAGIGLEVLVETYERIGEDVRNGIRTIRRPAVKKSMVVNVFQAL